MRRLIVRRGRVTSRIAFFIGILFCVLGVLYLLSNLLTPMRVAMAIGLICVLVSVTVTAYKNGFTDAGAPNEINTYEGEIDIYFDVKLRKLEKLKSDGLINQSEYSKKRIEILEDKW